LGSTTLADILVTPLGRFNSDRGSVWHGIKRSGPGFVGFGELYFSFASYGVVGRWKRHKRMTMNLVVPVGRVEFVFWDESVFREEKIGEDRYVRLTVPEGIWFSFRGLDEGKNIITNLASIEHDPKEAEHCDPNLIRYEWSKL
jgi:dTDP-4-dehydrorhamnose 3,5-epimerase